MPTDCEDNERTRGPPRVRRSSYLARFLPMLNPAPQKFLNWPFRTHAHASAHEVPVMVPVEVRARVDAVVPEPTLRGVL